MESCRACLSNAKNMVLFDDSLIAGYNLLTNLNIKPLDELSQYMCQICYTTVISFLNFREQCITSESTLRQKLSQTIKSELQNVKFESSETENTIVKIKTSEKRKVGRPRKAPLNKGDHKLEPINKNDTKRGGWRLSKKAPVTETWVVRPRKDPSTTNKDQKWVICPKKNMTTHKTQADDTDDIKSVGLASEIISDEKKVNSLIVEFNLLTPTKDVINRCDIAIKKEIESQDDNSVFENFKTSVSDMDISDYPVKEEHLKDLVNSNIIKPAENEDDDGEAGDEETSIPCGLCKKKLNDQQSFSNHLESHRTGTRCETCQEPFAEWQALLAHRLVHVKSRKSHKCHLCLKPQWSPLFFEYHYLSEHSGIDIEDVKMTCKICLKKYADPQKMRRHWKNNHKEVRYTCEKCSKAFAYKFLLREHERKHYDNKPFECDVCDFSTKFPNSLRVHILKKHTESSASCSKCSRVFSRKELLERHVCRERKEQMCPICGVVTTRLKRHMPVHSEVREFTCKRCPATFKSRGALQVHVNKHDDLRPHRCEFCPMRFNSRAVLIKHRRVHTGEKPYVCKVCDKGFTGNHNLKVHMRVHGEDLVVKRNVLQASEN